MATDAKLNYIRKWKSENVRQVRFEFNKVTDADVIAQLDAVENRTAYIKELIRADIAKREH